MSKIKIILRWTLVISVLIAVIGFVVWQSLRPIASEVSPVKGNPDVPARPSEAVRLEKMFNKLLQEQNKMPNLPPAIRGNKESGKRSLRNAEQ